MTLCACDSIICVFFKFIILTDNKPSYYCAKKAQMDLRYCDLVDKRTFCSDRISEFSLGATVPSFGLYGHQVHTCANICFKKNYKHTHISYKINYIRQAYRGIYILF